MNLNTIASAPGARQAKKRVGRGIGSGLGKTCGKGHKGQKSRSGGFHKINFEGGQMPLQRRLPKVGFKSRVSKYRDQITLSELENIGSENVDLNVLKAVGLVAHHISNVKVFMSGEITKPVHLKGIFVTKGARKAIEDAGGTVAG